ncbi:hypothetical protein Val02_00580 [Virgisporangium aliadipatigenens]|uniref:Uncharacterized protein n=1 Tax=Virgisporangium aliadipatigenens TaxID=741659 RepID=A0A8J3YEY2_9ACTN|nr:hypothetical protein [Virgisporangium aliadipatigenens]GIJ43172.1 hypothetical protein Val02_00580 [Virgisporangium aliadipatigenens]
MRPMATTPSDLPECRVHVARHPSRTVVTDRVDPSIFQGQLTHWLLGAVLTDERGLYRTHPSRHPQVHERADRPTRAIVIFIMFFVGVWTTWFIGMALGVLALVAITHLRDRIPRRSEPPQEDPRRITLFRQQDREAYDEALESARRFSAGWPSLAQLIDPDEARDTLARTLWDVAEVLAHRQAVHSFVAELLAYDVTGLPPESPVHARIREEEKVARDSLPAIEEELRAHLSNLRTMADSAEEFAREMELRERERAIGEAIDSARRKLDTTAAGRVAPATASRELADRTAAVLAAYRDLTSRYAS